MWTGKMKYISMWLFLAAVFIIVFIQFITGQNIGRLIEGNRQLLQEVNVKNDLRNLEADVLTVESDIRGAIITNNPVHLKNVTSKITNIKGTLGRIENESKLNQYKNEVSLLSSLVNQKTIFSYQLLQVYNVHGKSSAEAMINTERGKMLRDSISNLISSLEHNRQANLKTIMGSIESTGKSAMGWGIILAVIACITSVLTFLYIVNRGKQQQKMIIALNESEKKIRDSADIKEQFLANMSHEIRTPLNAILGFTNLLTKTKLSRHQKQYIHFIHSAGENLLTLINDILDLSKIDAGMLKHEEVPFSIRNLLSSIESMFNEKVKEKGIDFSVQIDPDIPETLDGDAVRLRQILINLINNAVKFTLDGSINISVHLIKKGDNNDLSLGFLIQDTGVGIAPEKMLHIFDRFQQAEEETTRRFGGTGLGLSIVKQLVELKGGTIEVQSNLGKGSQFKVMLPFKISHYAIPEIISSPKLTDALLKGQRVLVAEDNPMNQQLIMHLLNQWEIDYELVHNGQEVLDALERSSFSIILMDISMPLIDGYNATLVIRNKLNNSIPIIAMTAHAMVGERERCLSYGMNDYISKPIHERELLALLAGYGNEINIEPAGKKTIDLTYLKEIAAGDSNFQDTIIRQFISQIPEEIQLLEIAIQDSNLQQIKSLAHGMKSTVAYLGLGKKLHPFLQRMEMEAAGNESPTHFQEDMEDITIICTKAIQEAQELVEVPA